MGTLIGEKRIGGARIRSRGGIPVLEESFSYTVRASSKTEAREDILDVSGLPSVAITVSPSGYGVCRTKDANRDQNNPLIWHVTAEFSSDVEENQSGQDPTTDPTAWVPVYETKFERLSEIVTKDFSGTSIANSAGQPFENGLTIGRFIPVWDFFQFEPASVTDETIIARNETVNNATFKGRAQKTLLLTIRSSVVGFYYGQRRRLTGYSLKYNSRKWTHKRLDVGTVFLEGGELKTYTDEGDVAKDVEPQIILGALDGNGGKVAPGDPPALLEFDMYEAINFSGFLRT